jgi:uncharacterized protein involved in high-affinity Fe2+ transport
MKNIFTLLYFLTSILLYSQSEKPELIIATERVEPGILFIFEGAIKDNISPSSMHLSESETNIHIEARVNWDTVDIPNGAPAGGFIPYLYISTQIINQKTGLSTFVDLLPHINLVDNFHYARNISLPGSTEDTYSVKFNITQPSGTDLALHMDWLKSYGNKLLENKSFSYKNVDFSEVAKASRN